MKELDDLIAEIVVDCHDEDECAEAFPTVLGDEISVPFETIFLGMPVEVIAVGTAEPTAGVAPGNVGPVNAVSGVVDGWSEWDRLFGLTKGSRNCDLRYGAPYRRLGSIPPSNPVVPDCALGALRLPITPV